MSRHIRMSRQLYDEAVEVAEAIEGHDHDLRAALEKRIDFAACPCWRNSHALGHDGHCCFKSDGAWREDADVCHRPTRRDETA